MAFRRPSNGRSPLVNPQRQITSFFSKSPSPILSNSNTNPKPKPKPKSTTPSPLLTKRTNKPPLVLAPSPSDSPNPIHGHDLVHRRIKVYWPLDKTWYEGRVTSFDKTSGKHLVQYDDAEEEHLDLSKEKIELLNNQPKRFRRLRRFSIEDEDNDDDAGHGNVDNNVESGGDDSADEDWGINVEKEVIEDETEDLDLVDEDQENTGGLKKRKSSGMKLDSAKKIKTVDLTPGTLEPTNNNNNNNCK